MAADAASRRVGSGRTDRQEPPGGIGRSGNQQPILAEARAHMHRIGLALSGGGFRATLFHLGMIRFLREADILPAVTHITSVSGGSILAAHLVLNWQRYTGSLKEFDDAAAEVIRFVQLDVRNRVVRRYPLTHHPATTRCFFSTSSVTSNG
jgi:predicted acylesterase/phospholipase RssA